MLLSKHGEVPVMNVKGPFEGLTHQTLAGAELGTEGVALWQHYMTVPLSVPPHYHETEEVIVVLSGTLRFFVGIQAADYQPGTDPLADAKTIDCGPEATFVVPARAIHAYDIVNVPVRVLIFLADASAATLLPDGSPLPLPWQPSKSDLTQKEDTE